MLLYENRAAALLLYGRALGLNREEAEDVTQETFVALLQMREAPANPWFYCLRSFRNKALNHHRSLWRRFRREFVSQSWFETSSPPDPREQTAMRCLEKLPPEQREVIVLKIWQGNTFEEIATLLDESPNTVAARYRYGLGKLRKHLIGTDYEQPDNNRESLGVLETA